MKETHFSIREVLEVGWEGWKKHWGLLIGVVAIAVLLSSISGIGAAQFEEYPAVVAIFQFLGLFLGAFAHLGVINVALRIAKQLTVQLSDFFDIFSSYWRFFLGAILYGIAVAIGLVLLIVPGIYLATKYYLFPYYIIEKNMGVIESFKASGQATYGSKGKIFLFSILGLLLNIVGAALLIIGLFITLPLIAIAQAAIYKKLQSQLEEPSLITQSE